MPAKRAKKDNAVRVGLYNLNLKLMGDFISFVGRVAGVSSSCLCWLWGKCVSGINGRLIFYRIMLRLTD